ncbi:MAG: SH3 domain-containing protein [Bacteroidales bacterium]|nr:SH3 domain-containing protein [Bacteroidales bacterium]
MKVKYVILLSFSSILISCSKEKTELSNKLESRAEKNESSSFCVGYDVNVREQAKKESTVLFQINLGDSFQILEKSELKDKIGDNNSYWYRIKTDSGKEGWVYGSFISHEKNKDHPANYEKFEIYPINVETEDGVEEIDTALFKNRISNVSTVEDDEITKYINTRIRPQINKRILGRDYIYKISNDIYVVEVGAEVQRYFLKIEDAAGTLYILRKRNNNLEELQKYHWELDVSDGAEYYAFHCVADNHLVIAHQGYLWKTFHFFKITDDSIKKTKLVALDQ